MPIYEFTCASCGAHAEVIQHVGARPPACPKCGKRRLTRAVSRTSFQLKGGGWYADLYASPRPDTARKGDAEAGKTPETKPPAKTGGAEPAAATPSAAPPAGTAGSGSGPGQPAGPRTTPPARRRTASRRRR